MKIPITSIPCNHVFLLPKNEKEQIIKTIFSPLGSGGGLYAGEYAAALEEELSGGSKFRNKWRAAGLLSLMVPVMKILKNGYQHA